MPKKTFTIISNIVVVLLLIMRFIPEIWANEISNLEQQINIINTENLSTTMTESNQDNSWGLIHFDGADYIGETVYFEVVARCVSCTGGNERAAIALYNSSGVLQTTLYTSSATYSRVNSGSLVLPTGDYTIRLYRDATDGGTAYVKAARIIIDQSADPITDTQSQIEVGSLESTTSLSATTLSAPKIYQFDADLFDATTVTSYFEATLYTNDNDVTDTEYFNSYDTGVEEWSTNPSNMTDSNTASYASTSTDGQVQLLTGSTAAATDLGEINKVEIRAFGYQTDGADGEVILRPVFSGTDDGDSTHVFTPPQNSGNAAWSSFYDITSDTNAPTTWTWTDIDDLDVDVEFTQGASGTNTAFISRVNVIITYEDNTKIAYAELYNLTDGTVVATVSTSDNDPTRQRSSPLTTNWDTTNDDEYVVRIYTSDSGNTADIANAKIIIDQSDPSEISKTEVVHQMINTNISQTNSIYTEESYISRFRPNNFAQANNVKVYLDTTLRTSGQTGFVSLYNTSDSLVIDDPIDSEVTTTSTSFERQRSSNVGFNTDWPTEIKDLTTITKASSGETVYVTNSSLIIQAQSIDPELTFIIAGVDSGQTHNGVTTSVTSTVTSLPFGNLGLVTPAFAAHELQVQTNAAVDGYSVTAWLDNTLQGNYPANNIDPFTASGATWNTPVTWTSPNGTARNVNSGWIGANITDTDVTGWGGDTSGKFGPLDSTPIEVMTSTLREVNDTEYVNYGIEVNIFQPADTYAGTLIYNVLPIY